MARKKSILIYFDNFRWISDLPDEQLGILFRALMECGKLEAEGQDGITGFEQRYPDMAGMTRMAFRFMADNLRRDAAAYHEKCANYKAAAQRRREVSPPFVSSSQAAARPAPPLPERELAPISPEDMPPYIQEFLAKKQRRPQEAASPESHDSV